MCLLMKVVTLIVTLVLLQLTFLPKAEAATMSWQRCRDLKIVCLWDGNNYTGNVWTMSGTGCTNVPPSFNDKANSAGMYYHYGETIRFRIETYLHGNCSVRRDIVPPGKLNLNYKNQVSSINIVRF